jgi:hypothetical protein
MSPDSRFLCIGYGRVHLEHRPGCRHVRPGRERQRLRSHELLRPRSTTRRPCPSPRRRCMLGGKDEGVGGPQAQQQRGSG